MNWKRQVFNYGIRHKIRIRAVLNSVSPLAGKRCLDLGCGNGVFSWMLREEKAQPYGIDLSWEMVKLASADTDAVVGNASTLPFRPDVFDIVFALEVAYFLDEKAPAEIARVLKPGGLLVLTVLSDRPSLDVRRLYTLLGSHYVRGRREYHNEDMISRSYPGFKVVRSDSFSIFFVEILQAVLYRIREGGTVRSESLETHPPSAYRGVRMYRLLYPAFRVFFLLDALFKRLGASGHNQVYVLQVLKETGIPVLQAKEGT